MDNTDLRRSAAAVLAAAAVEVFPGTHLVDGQLTPEGYYYDFRFPFAFQKEFITLLEEKMRGLIKEGRDVTPLEMVPASAAAFLEHHGQPVRAEIVRQLGVSIVPIFKMGDFVDLCVFPLISDTSTLGVPALYDYKETGPGLTRIYGAVFSDKTGLKEFLKKRKEAPLKKNHTEWGCELDLFSPGEVEGVWRWHPKGEKIREVLSEFWREELRGQGFQLISAQGVHLPFLERYGRVAELFYGPLEKPLLSNGMLAPRAGFAEIAHILCEDRQLLNECISSLQFMIKISKILGFEHQVVLCADGKKSTKVLAEALKVCKLEYSAEENRSQRGPQIEMRVSDNLGRLWTSAYLGLDRSSSEKQTLVYRSLFTSLERITALLIERYEGALPFWLAPEQVRVLPVGAETVDAANTLAQKLQALKVRAETDLSGEKLSQRVHRGLSEKVPYLAIIGGREQQMGMVTVRRGQREETTLSEEAFIQELMKFRNFD